MYRCDFFITGTATAEIYTLSLHDALPIFGVLRRLGLEVGEVDVAAFARLDGDHLHAGHRSEEHTSELQSQSNLVCRLLLEKKNHTCRILSCPLCPVLFTILFSISPGQMST